MDVVSGLPDGRVGLLVAVHHVVADGLRGVAMMTGLFDPTPEPVNDAGSSVQPWRPPSWLPRIFLIPELRGS